MEINDRFKIFANRREVGIKPNARVFFFFRQDKPAIRFLKTNSFILETEQIKPISIKDRFKITIGF